MQSIPLICNHSIAPPAENLLIHQLCLHIFAFIYQFNESLIGIPLSSIKDWFVSTNSSPDQDIFPCFPLNFSPAACNDVIWTSVNINISALALVLELKSMCDFH